MLVMNKLSIIYYKKPIIFWLLVFTLFAIIFSQVDYFARENDSRLYTKFLYQLSEKPIKEIVVVRWTESAYTDPTSPYVRDHLIGQFIIPVLMVKLGMPASHALYLFNNLVQIAIAYALFYLSFLLTGRYWGDLLLFVSFLPQSWVYTLRANHEQPLSLMVLLAMIAGIQISKHRAWLLVGVISVVSAFLIKGLGFLMVPISFSIGVLFAQGIGYKQILRLFLYALLITMALLICIWVYEQWFVSLIGDSFFKRYWEIQISGRTLKTNSSFSLLGKIQNINYYFSRTLAYTAPWSLLFVGVLIQKRSEAKQWFKKNVRWIFALTSFVLLYILVFAWFDRKASRYLYPAYYFGYLIFSLSLYTLKENWSLAIKPFFKCSINKIHYFAALTWLFVHLLSLGKYIYLGGNNYWIK